MESPALATAVLPSKQKNCNNCVQTKRRCDRRTPVCSRCAERKVPCSYGKTKAASRNDHREVGATPHTDTLSFESPGASFFDPIQSLDAGYFDGLSVDSQPETHGLATHPVATAFASGDIPMDDFMGFDGIDHSSSSHGWLVPVDEGLVDERPGTPADEEIATSYQKMAPFCLLDSEAGRITATPTEKLARAQALFMYQIMRLFDENITLRSQAEKDMPTLESWLGELCKIRENLGNLEGDVSRNREPVEWERWIFAESLRRTIVMAYSVIVLYEMMKMDDEDDDDPGPWAFVHRWTLSRPLWNANSSFEFRRAWKENPQFIISNYSFENFLKHGRGEDVDDFAEILMTVYIGVDETKEFISSRKVPKIGMT
ncbi:hypothetical protein Daus18300_011904 [Diaporthe australafricana]|uniref:Zn(2)-C6 fungal-type domain-containing protein n=1 Tax=Diaporthe australafricana TaxID=127596 RepID=A0ABR3W4X4_9PEZI